MIFIATNKISSFQPPRCHQMNSAAINVTVIGPPRSVALRDVLRVARHFCDTRTRMLGDLGF